MRYLLGALVFVFFAAAPAFGAANFPCADNTTSCDPYSPDETDTVTSGWVGGDYLQCTARGKLGQHCWEKVETTTPDTYICGGVRHNGGCACNTKTLEVRGLCVYYP